MNNRRQEGIDAVRNTIEASVALREDLVGGEVVGSQMIDRLQARADVNECIYDAGENPAELLQTSSDAHEFYGRRRHDLRAVFIAAAQESGMSVTEIANRFGVSKQLIQRSVRQPYGEDELSPVSSTPDCSSSALPQVARPLAPEYPSRFPWDGADLEGLVGRPRGSAGFHLSD